MGRKEVSRVGERINPISVRSKRRITDALLELMQTTPFSKITVKDIVEKAGLTRQTFYHNFETREEVLLYRIDEISDGFADYLEKYGAGDWEAFLGCFFRYWMEHADFVQLLAKSDLSALLSAQVPKHFVFLRNDLPVRSGLTAAEAGLWYAFISGAVLNTLTEWIASGKGISAHQMAKLTVSMLDGSLAEQKLRDAIPEISEITQRLETDVS